MPNTHSEAPRLAILSRRGPIFLADETPHKTLPKYVIGHRGRHANLKDVLYETTLTPFGLCTVNTDAHLSCRKPEKREQSGRLGE